MERLQKYLSACGVASRRKSEELILKGKVKVNDKVITDLGFKVSDKDEVYVDNVQVFKKKGRTTVIDLIDTKEKIFPVGRLDYDTSGLLLLTNDGELTNKLTHPSHDIEKTYLAKIDGLITREELKTLERGVMLDGVKTKRAYTRLKESDKKNNKSYVEITITEGRNHQVKNMFMAVGHKVLKLKRIKYSFLNLSGLSIGEYRKLSIKEVKQLYSCIK